MIKPKKYSGVWFYGLSGSGKTYASKFLYKNIAKSILIDGDEVRRYISKDLGYSKKEREIQIQRVFGISKILINSKLFPIISTVYLNKHINSLCKKNKILIVRIIRLNFDQIIKKHKTYKSKKNIVGIDIKYEGFSSREVFNTNDKTFIEKILKLNL